MNILKKTKLAIAVTAFVGIASVSNVNAISVNTDGSGRYLFAPVSVAVGGNSTAITVTNPDLNRAVKAHLVLRSEKFSDEAFDFVIYMSPGDTFRGELYADSDGTVLFKSEDDSIKNLNFEGATENPRFVSRTDPLVDYVVPTLGVRTGDAINIGHLEVLSVYSVTDVVQTAAGPITIERGMPKTDLRQIFDLTTPALLDMNNCDTNGADGVSCTNIDALNNGILRGDIEMKLETGAVNYVMTGLVDSDENTDGNIECVANYCEKVNGNPFFNQTSSTQFFSGQNMGAPISSTLASHNLYNIERAMSNAHFNGTYEIDASHGTMMVTTLPTRYAHEGLDICSDIGKVVPVSSPFTSPFTSSGLVPYALEVFNNEERLCTVDVPDLEAVTVPVSGTECPPSHPVEDLNPDGSLLCWQLAGTIADNFITYEVQGLPIHCDEPEWFNENPSGWFKMNLKETDTNGVQCNYNGVPAIITVMKSSNGNLVDLLPTSH